MDTSLQLQTLTTDIDNAQHQRGTSFGSLASESEFPGIYGISELPRRRSRGNYRIIHPDRPLCILGYLCNDDLFLSVNHKSGKLEAIKEDNLRIEFSDDTDSHHEVELIEWKENDKHYQALKANELTVTTSHDSNSSEHLNEREMALMSAATGNIFDYKAEVIEEGNEEEEPSHHLSFVNSQGIEETKSEDLDDDDGDDDAASHVRGTSLALAEYDDDFDDFDFDVFLSHKNSETLTTSKSETEDDDGENEEEELIKTIKQAIYDNDADNNDEIGHCKRSTESILDKATEILNGDNDNDRNVDNGDDFDSLHSGSLSFNMEDLAINVSDTISLEMKNSLSDGLENERGKYSILEMFDRDEVVENDIVETERKYFVE